MFGQESQPMVEEEEQCRDVYAYYGLTMHCAQCLERQIALSLATVFGQQNIVREEYDGILESNFEKTMGKLINELLHNSSADARLKQLEVDLMRARDARNVLAHNYFWQKAVQFVTLSGREAMIAELDGLKDLFMSVDATLTELTNEWAIQHGVTQEDHQEALDSVLSGRPYLGSAIAQS